LQKPPNHSSTKPCRSIPPFTERVTGLQIRGLDLRFDVSGALHVPELRTIVVADLHLEKGSSYAMRGVFLPPYDTRSTLRALDEVCRRLRPERIISLGDSFHDGGARSRLDAEDLVRIRHFTEAHEVIWLAGNHDKAPPIDLGGTVGSSIRLGPITLRHEPSHGSATEPEIAGHLHPVAAIAQRGLRLRGRCFASDGERLIMPEFGSFTGGLNVRSPAISSLFSQGKFAVWMLGRQAVYAFPSRVLLPEFS